MCNFRHHGVQKHTEHPPYYWECITFVCFIAQRMLCRVGMLDAVAVQALPQASKQASKQRNAGRVPPPKAKAC